MVEPTGIASLILSSVRLLGNLGLFWHDSRSAPERVRSIWEIVDVLTESARSVREQLSAGRAVDDAEDRMRRNIEALADKCLRGLDRLQDNIPRLMGEGEETTLQSLRATLVERLNQDTVHNILTGITACNSALQVSMQALSIFKMEQNCQFSSMDIERQWDSVVDRLIDALARRPFRGEDPTIPEWNEALDDLMKSFREGASTHGDRSICAPPGIRRSSIPCHIAASDTRTLDSGVDMADSETEDGPPHFCFPQIPPNLVPEFLKAMLAKVDVLVQKGELGEAARHQKYVLHLRHLRRVQAGADSPVDTLTICRDEMRLACIYREMQTLRRLAQAEKILVGIRDRLRTEQLDSADRSERELELEAAQELGRVYLRLSRMSDAADCLWEIFNPLHDRGLVRPLIASSGPMLYQINLDLGYEVFAQTLDNYVTKEFGISIRVLAWCQKKGFDTDKEGFGFGIRAEEGGPEARGSAPIHLAAKSCEKEILKYMLEHDADPDVRDANGTTPVLLACAQQDPECLQILLNHGGNKMVKDSAGQGGLHLCQRKAGGTKVAQLLLSSGGSHARPGGDGLRDYLYGVDINAKDGYGNTALHVAAGMGNIRMIQRLLNLGAAVEAAGAGGCTPLMAAVQAVMPDRELKKAVLRVLVEGGADPCKTDYAARNAMDMANDEEIARMLRKMRRKTAPPTQPSGRSSLSATLRRWTQ